MKPGGEQSSNVQIHEDALCPPKCHGASSVYQEERERRLTAASKAVREGMSQRKAAKLHFVPLTALRNFILSNDRIPEREAPTTLSETEEQNLVTWCLEMARIGCPQARNELPSVVHAMLKGRKKMCFSPNKLLTKNWINGFIKRHPELSSLVPQHLDPLRATLSYEGVISYLEDMKEYLNSKNLEARDFLVRENAGRVFNCDERGFFINANHSSEVLFKKGAIADNHRGENRLMMSVLIGVSASGTVVKPLMLNKGKSPTIYEKHEGLDPKSYAVGYSDSGWFSGDIFYAWLVHIFNQHLINNSIQRPVVLFLNGHPSHILLETLRFARDNGIILYCFPPHASHILQPLDVAVFKELRVAYESVVTEWRETLTKRELPHFPFLFMKALVKGNVAKNTVTGFRAAGLLPFNPSIIRRDQLLSDINDLSEGDNLTVTPPEYAPPVSPSEVSPTISSPEDIYALEPPEDTYALEPPEDTPTVAAPEVIPIAASPEDTLTGAAPEIPAAASPGDTPTGAHPEDTLTIRPRKDSSTIGPPQDTPTGVRTKERESHTKTPCELFKEGYIACQKVALQKCEALIPRDELDLYEKRLEDGETHEKYTAMYYMWKELRLLKPEVPIGSPVSVPVSLNLMGPEVSVSSPASLPVSLNLTGPDVPVSSPVSVSVSSPVSVPVSSPVSVSVSLPVSEPLNSPVPESLSPSSHGSSTSQSTPFLLPLREVASPVPHAPSKTLPSPVAGTNTSNETPLGVSEEESSSARRQILSSLLRVSEDESSSARRRILSSPPGHFQESSLKKYLKTPVVILERIKIPKGKIPIVLTSKDCIKFIEMKESKKNEMALAEERHEEEKRGRMVLRERKVVATYGKKKTRAERKRETRRN